LGSIYGSIKVYFQGKALIQESKSLLLKESSSVSGYLPGGVAGAAGEDVVVELEVVVVVEDDELVVVVPSYF